MRICILGSSGLIGSALSDFLQMYTDHEVYDYDLHHTQYTIDLRQDTEELDLAIETFDFFVFLAFDVGGSVYLADRQHSFDYIDDNILMMHNVFSKLKQYNKPFIFASSQMSNMIDSPYGMLKRIGEYYTHALNGINVRFWNVYGTEHDPSKFHVITDFLRSAKHSNIIEMRTDGTEMRQFLHAYDSATALALLIEKYNDAERFESYDITSYNWTAISALAGMVVSLYPAAEVVLGNKKDTTQSLINQPNFNMGTLGWKPTISLMDGIKMVNKDI